MKNSAAGIEKGMFCHGKKKSSALNGKEEHDTKRAGKNKGTESKIW